MLVALRQDHAVLALPPLEAVLQAPLDVNLDHQLGVLPHPADDPFLRRARRAVQVVPRHLAEPPALHNRRPEGKVRPVEDARGDRRGRLQSDRGQRRRRLELDRVALVGADQIVRSRCARGRQARVRVGVVFQGEPLLVAARDGFLHIGDGDV